MSFKLMLTKRQCFYANSVLAIFPLYETSLLHKINENKTRSWVGNLFIWILMLIDLYDLSYHQIMHTCTKAIYLFLSGKIR